MQIRAHQTLASLFLSLQTSVTIISRHNPKTQAKHDRQEFKHWECTRVNVNLYFWSLRPHRRDSSKNHQERNNCWRVSGQMTVSFNSWQLLPPPPPTPRHRLNSGKTSKHQWDRLNCFSIAEECSALHIHSQTGQGRISCQIHKYNIKCSSLLLCLPQLNIFDPLQDWIQQICRCDNLGETDY